MDYFLGTDWNMMVVDLVFGLFWIAIIFGFVTQLLLLYGIQKLNEAFMLPHLILKMSGLFVSFLNVFKKNISSFLTILYFQIGTISAIIFLIKKYMQNDTEYFVLYVSGFIFAFALGFYEWDVV